VAVGDPARRAEICKARGLKDEAEAYRMITEGARSGVQKLLMKKLTSPILQELGYTLPGMRKLGYSDEALQQLGYISAGEPAAEGAVEESDSAKIRQNLKDGWRAENFRQHGITLHHLKRAGCMIIDLSRAGFQLDELASIYSAGELRRSGFGIRDLRRHFRGHELRTAGFDASDMRNAGFGIRELLNYGYNENQVKTAGYSINELSREGLTRQTVDKTRRA
jgi:intracellular multiplication protein IcmE